MRRLVAAIVIALGVSFSLASCDMFGQQTNNDYQQVSNGLNP